MKNHTIATSIFSLFLLLSSIQIGWSQTRLVLNGAKINIANGAILVIENPATNAITRTDGHIISEGENNLLKWMIGTTTGTYTVPWGKGTSDYIPLSFTKTAGTGSGFFLFSGYSTPSLNSTLLPTSVTNFTGASGSDKSLFATDRFWQISAQSYTTKPSLSNLTFTYLDTEFASPNNTSTESSLTAQRWNPILSSWLDYGPSSTVNTTANAVSVASVVASDFYPWWVVNYIDDRYWVAATSSTGGNVSDWSYTSGGSGGAALPTALDAVLFENTNSSSITLSAPMVMRSLSISGGYTGVITQGANTITTMGAATFSGGTFIGGSADIAVGGAFSLLGTTFTSTTTLLDLKNNFTFNSGTFNHNNGRVRFSGTATQDVSGTLVTNFNNIDVTNATVNPGVRIQSDQNLNGVLTLSSNAVVDTDGSNNTSVFKLISLGDSPTLDASIGALPSGARVDGKITVQRYMTKAEGNNSNLYRYISSPLQDATVADIQNELPVTGTFTGRSVCSGCGTYVNLYYYDETVITDLSGYIKFPSATNTEIFQPGRGYTLYVYGNLLSSTSWDVRGNINAGNFTPVSLPVSYTSSGTAANDGWNMVGNPFPSTVDWNSGGWTKTNLENAIYITDNGSGTIRYATYNGLFGLNGGSQYIALGQAFWIKASGAGTPALTANENAKAAGTQTTFFRVASPDNFLRITLAQGSITDETIVHFRSDATSSFDSNLDARKFMNTSVNLSSLLADGSKLAINSLPALNCQASVKLSIDNVSNGTYRFDFSELASFDSNVSITLSDKFLNKTVDVKIGSYSFSVTSDVNSKGSGRFELILSTTAPTSTFTLSTLPVCEGVDASIQILNSQNGIDYTGMIAGTVVTQSVKGNGGTIKFSIPKNKLLAGQNTVTINASIPNCSNRIQKNIVVTVNPTSIPSVENGVVCKQGVITLKATGAIQNGSYRWYESLASSEAIAGQQTATLITPLLTTSKTYYVSIVNSSGCEGVRTAVTANVIQYNDVAITEAAGLMSSNYSQGNQWYLNGEVIAGATSQTLRAEASGLYKVEVKVGSCSTSAELSVVIICTAPTSTFTLSTLPVCEGVDAFIQILNSQNGIDYAGMIAGTVVTQSVKGNGGTIQISIPKNKLLVGQNTVTINASIPDCSNRIQKNIVVTVNPTSIPSVENGVVCKQGVITLKAAGAMQNGSYQWYESLASSEAIAGQHTATLITPLLTTSKTYYVSIINSFGCEGARTPVTANVIQYNDVAITEAAGLMSSNYSQGNQWYLNGEVIAGATSQTLRAEASGLYKVEVGSCSTSAELSVTITSLEGSDETIISIFPNPVVSTVLIEIPDSFENWHSVKLLTSTGAELRSEKLFHAGGMKRFEMDMQKYAPGVYIITIVGNSKVAYTKIIKQ